MLRQSTYYRTPILLFFGFWILQLTFRDIKININKFYMLLVGLCYCLKLIYLYVRKQYGMTYMGFYYAKQIKVSTYNTHVDVDFIRVQRIPITLVWTIP